MSASTTDNNDESGKQPNTYNHYAQSESGDSPVQYKHNKSVDGDALVLKLVPELERKLPDAELTNALQRWKKRFSSKNSHQPKYARKCYRDISYV